MAKFKRKISSKSPNPKKPTGNKMGRKKIELNWKLINNEEKGMTFQLYFKKKSAGGKMSLRRKQFEVAQKGNVSMLIFLGKNYLDQSDQTKDKSVMPSLNDVDWNQIGKSFATAAEKIATKIPIGLNGNNNGD
jgi:ribosome biogenesis protein Tsr3